MSNPTREEATLILRQVPDDKAFYFYSALGAPTGIAAKSLDELVAKLENIDQRAAEFHFGRGDFEKWIAMLGDATLASDISSLKNESLAPEEMRRRMIRIMSSRIFTLKRASSGREESPRKASPRAR